MSVSTSSFHIIQDHERELKKLFSIMIFTGPCSSNVDPVERRRIFQGRKLEMLTYMRDALERRLAALDASIQTLQNQINRDKED